MNKMGLHSELSRDLCHGNQCSGMETQDSQKDRILSLQVHAFYGTKVLSLYIHLEKTYLLLFDRRIVL